MKLIEKTDPEACNALTQEEILYIYYYSTYTYVYISSSTYFSLKMRNFEKKRTSVKILDMQVVMSGSDLCGNMYNKQVLDIQFTNFINDSMKH